MAEPRKESLIDLVAFAKDVANEPNSTLKRTLQAIRIHLGMQVAFVSEFTGGQIVLREVDAPGLEARIKVGNSYSLDHVYCGHILAGRLPELIPDTSLEPFAMALPITAPCRFAYQRADPAAGWQGLWNVLLRRLRSQSIAELP